MDKFTTHVVTVWKFGFDQLLLQYILDHQEVEPREQGLFSGGRSDVPVTESKTRLLVPLRH